MPGKSSTTANFKKAVLSFLEHDGVWSKVPASLKKPFSCVCFLDNPQLILNDESHFIGAYLTKQAFDSYRRSKAPKLSEAHSEKFKISDWMLELVKVDSETIYTSYADREVRLIVKNIKADPDSKISPNSFIDNLHRDNDVKLQVSRMNLEEIRENTEVFDCGDLSRYEESKKTNVNKDAVREVSMDEDEYTSVLTMKEILKKEKPNAVLNIYEPTEENSSFSKKRERKEERKTRSSKVSNPAEIKKAVQRIIKY